jgi:hypothetical protein
MRSRFVDPYWAMIVVLFAGVSGLACAAENDRSSCADPIVATFDGGNITLGVLEEFSRELPMQMRVPRLADAGQWREFVCRELAKDIVFTSRALALGYDRDPRGLRSRGYFINEYFSYVMLRDHVINRIDASRRTLEDYYAAHRRDFQASATVSLRLVRTRTREEATSALSRINAGETFERVENEMSVAGPRQKAHVLGPFPEKNPGVVIPPPPQVIRAAELTDAGMTTGVIEGGGAFFVVRTESRTAARDLSFGEVASAIEQQIRTREGDRLTSELIAGLRAELNVREDEALLEGKDTRPEDVVATIGSVLITRQEYDDLNGRVRGPALEAARLESSRLRKFVLPWIFAEAARRRGCDRRPEFQKALFYYDLQHLAARLVDEEAGKATPEPTDAEIREHFEKNREQLRRAGGGRDATVEQLRDSIRDSLYTSARQRVEMEIVNRTLEKAGFRMTPTRSCCQLTAYEALQRAVRAGKEFRRLISVRSGFTTESAGQNLPGRSAYWEVVADTNSGTTTFTVSGAIDRPVLHSGDLTALDASKTTASLWQFDSDALARQAIDGGLADFAAKHNGGVRVAVSVDIEERPGKAAECWITYAAVPTDAADKKSFALTYSAGSGELVRKRSE